MIDSPIQVITVGGLGNQLFQIANGLALSLRLNRPIKFLHTDTYRESYLETLGIRENVKYFVKKDSHLILSAMDCGDYGERLISSNFHETVFHFQPILLPKEPVTIHGYFQSHKYFQDFGSEIANYFKGKLFLNCMKKKVLERETSSEREITAVHVRLGDYATNMVANSYHGLLPEEYFLTAVNTLVGTARDLVIVTETPSLLRSHYPKLVSGAKAVVSASAIDDLYYLSTSRRLVLSNSSFSWWAAYLSDAEVIAPRAWFSNETLKKKNVQDIYLSHWRIL